MSIKHRLRTVICCTILEAAALFGVPMRLREVQDLLRSLNTPTIARTTPDERDHGAPPGSSNDRRRST